MATVEQLAQALLDVPQQLGEAQRLATDAQRAGVPFAMSSTGQVDPRVMNKCSTFTECSEWSFIFESVAPWRSSDGQWMARSKGWQRPFAELTPEIKLSAKQLYYLLVNTVRGKELTLVRGAEKHHGIAAWRRIKTEYQPDAAGRHTAMPVGIMQPGWESRGAANTFLDQLPEWGRRIQEYEGESLETL